MCNDELDMIIDWCREKIADEKLEHRLNDKELDGYDIAMKAVMSYLQGLKEEEAKREQNVSKEKQIEELLDELIRTNGYGTLNAVANHLYNAGYRKQSELTPCDLCEFNHPSSGDGKPCSICPAQAKMKGV